MNKKSQNTILDKEIQNNKSPYGGYYHEPKQQVLPFDGSGISYDLKEMTREKEKARQEDPIKDPFKFPNLTEQNIRSRSLTPEEIEELKLKDQKEYEDGLKSYYGRNATPPNPEKYEKINEKLPEEIKQEVLKAYANFKEVAEEFHKEYKEANELCSDNFSLDYSLSYLQLMKEFPLFLIKSIKKEIGSLFGIIPEGRRSWDYNSKARQLASFINNGLNIFNTTPLNYEQKIHEMSSASHYMRSIMAQYKKSKIVLVKLPAFIEQSYKDFIAKTSNRDFLKWMEEHFANDKKDFMDNILHNILSDNDNKENYRYISMGDLKKIRTYKSIYEKSSNTTEHIYNNLKHKSLDAIKQRLNEEVSNKLKGKITTLKTIMENQDSITEFRKYLYKNFKIDINSIIGFVNMIIEKYYGFETDPNKEVVDSKKKLFIQKFFAELSKDLSDISTNSYRLNQFTDNYVDIFLKKFQSKSDPKLRYNDKFDIKEFSKLTSKEIDDIISQIFRDVIVNALPNFQKQQYGNKIDTDLPLFIQVGDLIKRTGKFSIDAVTNNIAESVPFLPKEFALNLAKSLFKGIGNSTSDSTLKTFGEINQLKDNKLSMQVLLDLLNRSGKMNPNSFVTTFTTIFNPLTDIVRTISRDIRPAPSEKDIRQILSLGIRNLGTVEQDIKNLKEFVDFAHNNASDLSNRDLMIIFHNKNFIGFSKIGIAKKIIKLYAKLRTVGGLSGIRKKYARAVTQLIRHDYISKNFYNNVSAIINLFNSKEVISPASANFSQIFEAASALETDLEMVEMSDTFKDLLKDTKPKDPKLFDLNLDLNSKLRFRVLKDKDPRMLRVGVETDCCQRIGGAAESAAKDSFMNPLAGVVILEKRNGENWDLLAQSYFHYVPKDNGYILDNVETNRNNVKTSGIDLEAAYAYLAKFMK